MSLLRRKSLGYVAFTSRRSQRLLIETPLQSTKVGVAVNRQKHHTNKDVVRVATEIVQTWKEDINKGKASKTANGSPKKSSKAGTPTASGKSQSPEAKVTVPPEQRTWKTDNVDPKRTGNTLRDNCVGLMYDGLAHKSKDCKACSMVVPP